MHTGVLLFDERDKIAMINSEFKRIFKISFEDKNIIGVDQAQVAKDYEGLFVTPDKFYGFVDRAKNTKQKTYAANGRVEVFEIFCQFGKYGVERSQGRYRKHIRCQHYEWVFCHAWESGKQKEGEQRKQKRL